VRLAGFNAFENNFDDWYRSLRSWCCIVENGLGGVEPEPDVLTPLRATGRVQLTVYHSLLTSFVAEWVGAELNRNQTCSFAPLTARD